MSQYWRWWLSEVVLVVAEFVVVAPSKVARLGTVMVLSLECYGSDDHNNHNNHHNSHHQQQLLRHYNCHTPSPQNHRYHHCDQSTATAATPLLQPIDSTAEYAVRNQRHLNIAIIDHKHHHIINIYGFHYC